MKREFQLKIYVTVLLIFITVFSVKAQLTNAVTVTDYKLDSKLMEREMPYRVVFPKNYETDKTGRFTVIYLLHGLTGHFDNWGDKTSIAKYLEAFNFIVVMPEGDNGWYSDSATVAKDKYESYIIKELIPAIDKNFRTNSTRDGRIITGLSMGGYGSLKFGLKYPEMFTLVGSFSGALGAASWSTKTLGGIKGVISDSIMGVYGADDSQTRQANDIFKIAKELPADKVKQLPFIYLDCGTEDFLIGNAREFHRFDGKENSARISSTSRHSRLEILGSPDSRIFAFGGKTFENGRNN
jgi:putative tributyrin esterase